jgi:tetrapyrrole methylase family protein/MazG family protein
MAKKKDTQQDLGSFEALVDIIARLRAPDGCPWDRKQTHSSIRPYLIEEAYEALQALDEENSDKLREELGDLLLQIVLHAQMAREAGEFDIGDVIRGIATKLVRRHPHVFGDSKASNAEEVALAWETLKQDERKPGESLLASVPKGMPALSYSHSIQRRAAGVGFDWKDSEGVLAKLAEEVSELQRASTTRQKIHEFGDVLFALVNVARWQGLNLEEALRLANERFCRRFRYMEEVCRERGLSLRDLSFEEQNALWDEAKDHTR